MNAESVNRWLEGLPLRERAKLLSLIAYQLTVQARRFYRFPPHSVSNPPLDGEKLAGINELQHQLISQAGHYWDGEERKVYPIDVFSRILFEVAAQHGVTSDLAAAVKYVQEGTTKGATGRG